MTSKSKKKAKKGEPWVGKNGRTLTTGGGGFTVPRDYIIPSFLSIRIPDEFLVKYKTYQRGVVFLKVPSDA